MKGMFVQKHSRLASETGAIIKAFSLKNILLL